MCLRKCAGCILLCLLACKFCKLWWWPVVQTGIRLEFLKHFVHAEVAEDYQTFYSLASGPADSSRSRLVIPGIKSCNQMRSPFVMLSEKNRYQAISGQCALWTWSGEKVRGSMCLTGDIYQDQTMSSIIH